MVRNPDSLRNRIAPRKKTEPTEEEPEGKSNRVNIRLSKEYLDFIKKEAKLSGATVSSICSIAIAEWVVKKMIERKKLDANYDLFEFIRDDPEVRSDLQKYLDKTK